MKRKNKVVVGMSGGVDSCVAAALLQEAGYEVHGVTLKIWADRQEEAKVWKDRSCCKVGMARYAAEGLGIPYTVRDVQNAFEASVIGDFTAGYLEGQTPNPCVRCNERIKFGMLWEAAQDLGADMIATGHYARVDYSPERRRYLLKRAADPLKDQTYFLYRLRQDILSRILFPLGDLTKAEVWEKARALDLPVEEMTESQEVCFVTQKDYREFLAETAPQALRKGAIVSTDGTVVGGHHGVAFYTVGQRRGLGVAAGERLYVVRVDPEQNQVVVGEEQDLYRRELIAGELNMVACEKLEEPRHASARIRYRGAETPVQIVPQGEGRVKVEFSVPQRAVSPGQSVVFYDGEELVGGGIIKQ